MELRGTPTLTSRQFAYSLGSAVTGSEQHVPEKSTKRGSVFVDKAHAPILRAGLLVKAEVCYAIPPRRIRQALSGTRAFCRDLLRKKVNRNLVLTVLSISTRVPSSQRGNCSLAPNVEKVSLLRS